MLMAMRRCEAAVSSSQMILLCILAVVVCMSSGTAHVATSVGGWGLRFYHFCLRGRGSGGGCLPLETAPGAASVSVSF